MAELVERMWCRTCDDWRRCTSPKPNHILHLILSIVTAGLWMFVWFFALFATDFTCTECGSKVARRDGRKALRMERAAKRRSTPTPADSAAYKAGKALQNSSHHEFIPPKPSVLHETARAEWEAKYGKKG